MGAIIIIYRYQCQIINLGRVCNKVMNIAHFCVIRVCLYPPFFGWELDPNGAVSKGLYRSCSGRGSKLINSLSAKSVLAGEKLLATYSIST